MKGGNRKTGLARALSKLGYCSRSQAAELIRQGRVRVNGKVRRDVETPTNPVRDRIEVGGARIDASQKVYLMLNKPRGVVTTASDEKGRTTVYDFLKRGSAWVSPVGRLDKASEGLLLVTNDPAWSARITSPESHLDKTYHVRIDASANEALIESLLNGFRTGDGDFLRVKGARIIRGPERRAWLEIVLDEGKNRHIRRMFEHLGIEVLRLVRVAIGPLLLGELSKGDLRELTPAEKKSLDETMRRAARDHSTGLKSSFGGS